MSVIFCVQYRESQRSPNNMSRTPHDDEDDDKQQRHNDTDSDNDNDFQLDVKSTKSFGSTKVRSNIIISALGSHTPFVCAQRRQCTMLPFYILYVMFS